MRQRWTMGVVVAVMVAVTGCSKRPEGMPGPDPGWFADMKEGCPDLRGTYTFRHTNGTGGRQVFLGQAMEGALGRAPEHHSVWSIDSIDDQEIVLSSQASTKDIHQAFNEWRDTEPYQYALWSQSLVSRQAVGGRRLEHDPNMERKAPGFLAPQWRREISGVVYECEKGWVVFSGDEMPSVDNLRLAQVRMTRAKDGGLVAFARFRVQQSFSIWCGDGCKPDIDLGEGEREYWWHAAPAEKVVTTPIDWQAWIDDDDRPLKERTRYVDGTFSAYATQDDIDGRMTPKEPSGQAPKIDEAQILEDIPSTRSASVHSNQPVALHSVPKVSIPMCSTLEQQLAGSAKDLVTVEQTRCSSQQCTIEGTTPSNSQLSNTLRAMDQAGIQGVELVSLVSQEGAIRFVVQVDHVCPKS